MRRTHTSTVLPLIGVATLLLTVGAFMSGYRQYSAQLAAGAMADMQCTGDYDPTYQFPKQNPKTKKIGLLGKPCFDETNGGITSGTCQAAGKCKGEKTDGMPPMLPMLPMMMPKMMMPMMPMQPNCFGQPSGTTSTASTTGERATDPNCPQFNSDSNWANSIFDSSDSSPDAGTDSSGGTSGTSGSAGSSVWSRLLNSLGIETASTETGGSAVTSVSYSGSTTAGVAQNADTAALSPNSTYVSGDLSQRLAQGSTFSYQGAVNSVAAGASGVLGAIRSALLNLLQIVSGK